MFSALAFVDREARVRRVDHDVEQLVVGRIDVQQVHAGRGHHHIASRHVGDAHHAFQHDAGFGVDDVVVFGLGQDADQLIDGVGTGVDEFCELLQESTFVFLPQAALRPGTGRVVCH